MKCLKILSGIKSTGVNPRIKKPLVAASLGQLSDVVSTKVGLSLGYVELNPLVGQNPSVFVLFFIKLFAICMIVFLCHGKSRIGLLYFATLMGFGAAGYNICRVYLF